VVELHVRKISDLSTYPATAGMIRDRQHSRIVPKAALLYRLVSYEFGAENEAQLGRTAGQIKCQRSYKNPARNLASLVHNLTSPDTPSWIGNSHIDGLPLHTANSSAAKLQHSAQYQDASSFHKCARSIPVPALS
jgi:hypothetical protein